MEQQAEAQILLFVVKMKISELHPGQGSVNIQLTVKSVETPKIINKYGKELKLTNAIVTDGESEIKLTLWNDDVDKIKPGLIVKIENGYVNEFQGEKQLTTGKFGKLEILDGSKKENNSGKKSDKEDSVKEERISFDEDEEIEDY
jgi:replication factor A1